MQWVGPIELNGNTVNESVSVPLATYETPLWPSVGRGAKISRLTGGITATVIDARMTRSILLEAPNAYEALKVSKSLQTRIADMNQVVSQSSRFAQLLEIKTEINANMLFIRLAFSTGDAAGHNMVTNAADKLIGWILEEYAEVRYVSISGNYCTDKKPTAINGILGRGKNVVTEITIPRDICIRSLRTTPEAMAELNVKKNLIGTLLAGSIRSANAHYANMLLAFYLATGQDAANIVEGSQGVTHCEVRDDQLYFACTLPNIIVGSVGNGKGLDFVAENLKKLGCKEPRETGENANRLAAICAATVLCGELSLMAAQTNPGELMATHLKLERK